MRPSTWIHAKHVDYLDELLVRLHSRELLRAGYIGLIIEEPPRHGKSELATHYDTVYYLGAHPDHRVIITTYAHDFAADWGRKSRDTFDKWGPELYNLEVNSKSAAANRWDIKGQKGGVFTAGVGGQITGRGGNYLKADDLVKNWEEAQSETMRNKAWDFFTSTLRTRLEPDGIILVIGTRWHEDDVIGRLLAQQGDSPKGKAHNLYDPTADKYLRVRLPALAEEPDEEYPDPDPLGREIGEPLFPERYDVDALRPFMANAAQWASLYQQRPVPPGGALFMRDWFEVVPRPRGRFKRQIRRWDMAATDEKAQFEPDYTVGILIGEHEDGFFYVLDMVRVQEDPGKVSRTLKRTAQADGRSVRIRMEREPGASGKMVIYTLAKSIFRGYSFRGVPSTGSKMLRADIAAAAAERGEIKIVRGSWNSDFFYEITRFPRAAHDDIVDAFAGGLTDLTRHTGGIQVW